MLKVALALKVRDISECLVPHVEYVGKLLGLLAIINSAAPGFVDELLSFAPHSAEIYKKRMADASYQRKFDQIGFGDEYRAVVEAGNSPHQTDYMALMVKLQMKMTGCNQAQAIQTIAEQSGRDPDSLRRTVTKSKARKK